MKDLSTFLGHGTGSFPETCWSVIQEAGDSDSPAGRAALGEVAAAYWRPVYAYLRRKWRKSNEEAKDLTQEFFLALAGRSFLGRLSPERGRFRSYVMATLDNFARQEHRARMSLKRGAGARHFSIETEEDVDPASSDTPEQLFLREWAGSILDQALQELERESYGSAMEEAFRLFVLHEVERPADADLSYEGLARQTGLNATQVRNLLYRARKRFREIVLRRVRKTVSSDEEAAEEMRELFQELCS